MSSWVRGCWVVTPHLKFELKHKEKLLTKYSPNIQLPSTECRIKHNYYFWSSFKIPFQEKHASKVSLGYGKSQFSFSRDSTSQQNVWGGWPKAKAKLLICTGSSLVLPKRRGSSGQGNGLNTAETLQTLATIQVMWAYAHVFCSEDPERSSALKYSQHGWPIQLLREQKGRGISLLTPLTPCTCWTAQRSLVKENKVW